nr:replication initiation protein [Stutzerimonas kunmingensis]
MAEHSKRSVTATPPTAAESPALARVLSEAPYLSRCSTDKTAARIRPREYAVRYPYMQINRSDMVSWLIFDLDHPNALAWDDEGLPPPNLIVRNRINGHSHLFYAVHPICTSERARSAPIQYMKAIYVAYAERLGADLEYASGPVAKTPGHPWWNTEDLHGHVYHLAELANEVELAGEQRWRKGPRVGQVGHSRHCLLFENLRYHAYRIVQDERDRGGFESFTRRLELYAKNQNNFVSQGFAENLQHSSLKATVKSVARWTWDRYQGGSACRRGVMRLSPELPLSERQRLAAQRTHGQRAVQTEDKVRRACQALRASRLPLTYTAIAAAARLTRQTVAKYKHILDEPAAEQQARAVIVPITSVKHAVHQVSGPCPGVGEGSKGGEGCTNKSKSDQNDGKGVNRFDRPHGVPYRAARRATPLLLAAGNKWRILGTQGGDPNADDHGSPRHC